MRDPRRSGNPQRRANATKIVAAGKKPKVTWRDWVSGARLRTLPLAFAPVIAGAGIAKMLQSFSWTLSVLALAVSVFLQIGVNFANDYSDGVRGTDRYRVGPQRLTASGLVNPKRVLTVALVFFALAALAGIAAVVISGRYWFLMLGAVAILAAWFYTGGRKPYGYMGLGEIFVFVFFGLVATVGTVWLQSDTVSSEPWIAGSAIGFFAVAVLIANNTRDIETDKKAGKNTFSVKVGPIWSRILYIIFVLTPFIVPGFYGLVYPGMVFAWLVLIAVIPAIVIMIWGKSPRELVTVLVLTSYSGLLFAVALAIAFAF